MKTLFLLASAFAFFCTVPVKGGEPVKESRNVDPFTSISLNISADVFLTQGSPQKIEMEGDSKSLAEIETTVSGGKLKIQTKSRFGGNLGHVSIYITIPEIDELSVAGSGNITAKSSLKSDELDMEVSGSGSVSIKDLDVREASATITGSGNINIASGQAQSELDVVITGSGSFSGEGFSADEVDVTITGSGSAEVWAVKELDTNITGSGNVGYKGNPQVSANTTGSGRTHSRK
jgi:hypothetical protein